MVIINQSLRSGRAAFARCHWRLRVARCRTWTTQSVAVIDDCRQCRCGQTASDTTALSWLNVVPVRNSPRGLLAVLAAATVGLFLCRRLVNIFQRYVEAGAGSRMVYALATDLISPSSASLDSSALRKSKGRFDQASNSGYGMRA